MNGVPQHRSGPLYVQDLCHLGDLVIKDLKHYQLRVGKHDFDTFSHLLHGQGVLRVPFDLVKDMELIVWFSSHLQQVEFLVRLHKKVARGAHPGDTQDVLL